MIDDVTLEIDCRGLRCPQPVIALAGRLADIEIGEILAVVADDVAARTDIPAWCRMRGQEFIGEDRAEDATARFQVRRVS